MSKPKHSRLCPTFGINPRVGFKCKACTVPPKGTSKPKTKPASPWQPIETAPRDARQILFFWPSEDSLGPSYAIGQIASGGFYDEYGTEDDNEFWRRPLYWMPIPPLPEGER